VAEKSTPCIDNDRRLLWPYDRNQSLEKQNSGKEVIGTVR